MSYCCTYNIKHKEKKNIKEYFNVACFSQVYNILHEFEYIEVIVFKNYNFKIKYSVPENDNIMGYNDDEVIEYTKILNNFHNCIELNVNGKYKIIDKDDDSIKNNDSIEQILDCYIFKVTIDNIFVTKIMLNFIRYLHEINYIEIPKTLLSLNKNVKFTTLYNKMMISHHITTYNAGGHDVCGPYAFFKLLTNKEVDELKEKNKNNTLNALSIIPKYGMLNNVSIKELSKLLKKDTRNGFDFYKTLVVEHNNKEKEIKDKGIEKKLEKIEMIW